MQILCSSNFHDCFCQLFLILYTISHGYQHTIIISYVLLTNYTLILFDHPLQNLKHITLLIIPPHSVSKSLHFVYAFGLVIILPGLFLCYQILILAFVCNITPPPSLSMSSWVFCSCKTPVCSLLQRFFQNIPITSNKSIVLTTLTVFVDI